MNSGQPEQEFQRGRNRSSSVSAGISPYDGKSVNYLLFTYRQLFVDMVELKAYNASILISIRAFILARLRL